MDDSNFCRHCGISRVRALELAKAKFMPLKEKPKQPSPEKAHTLKIEEEMP
jgi:hypothetical protein